MYVYRCMRWREARLSGLRYVHIHIVCVCIHLSVYVCVYVVYIDVQRSHPHAKID